MLTPAQPKFSRRNVIIEENIQTDNKFSVTVGYPPGADIPRTGEFLQFSREDGGYASYVVVNVVHREVYGSESEYDLYILVSRTSFTWRPIAESV